MIPNAYMIQLNLMLLLMASPTIVFAVIVIINEIKRGKGDE